MKKLNFKKLFVFSLLAVAPFTLCACDLSNFTAVEINQEKYLNQVVATTSNGYKLTLEDLLIAYNNYGYKYESENGETREDSIKLTLEKEIQRKLAVSESKKLYESLVTNAEKNQVFMNTFNALNTNLATYEKEIREEKGYGSESVSESEENTEKGTTKNQYTPKAYVVDGKIYLNQDAIDMGYEGNANAELIANEDDLYNAFMKYRKITTQEVSDLALTRYIKNLKVNEEGRNLSTADKDVFTREIERIYEIQLDNFYIEKLETEYYKNNLITESDILNYYKSLVTESYNKYQINLENYYTDMQEDSSKVYYHPTNEYKYVSHILLAYTEQQSTQITKWESDLKSGRISKADYEANMEWMKTQITVQPRDKNGAYYGTAKTVSQIYNEVLSAVNAASTIEEKATEFNNLIYKYNSDPGIMNTDYDYVVGLTHSAMVDEFNKTSRDLYNQGKGNIGLAYTEFGVHIIMYTGDVSNVVEYGNINNVTLEKLANTKLKAGDNKTLFDKLYDELYSAISSTLYSNYQTDLIETLQENIEIEYNKNVYKVLFK